MSEREINKIHERIVKDIKTVNWMPPCTKFGFIAIFGRVFVAKRWRGRENHLDYRCWVYGHEGYHLAQQEFWSTFGYLWWWWFSEPNKKWLELQAYESQIRWCLVVEQKQLPELMRQEIVRDISIVYGFMEKSEATRWVDDMVKKWGPSDE